jgi:hypothetical protein
LKILPQLDRKSRGERPILKRAKDSAAAGLEYFIRFTDIKGPKKQILAMAGQPMSENWLRHAPPPPR